MITAEERERLHLTLDSLLDRDVENISPVLARGVMGEFSSFARRIVGGLLTVLDRADTVCMPSEHDAALARFARRLRYFAPLLDVPNGLSTADVFDELIAIAHGDAPDLLRRRANHGPAKGFNLARRKLGALFWEGYLEWYGVPTTTRQSWIAEAFGAPWDTISRWRIQVEQRFGRAEVEKAIHRQLYQLRRAALDEERTDPTPEELRASVLAAGRAFQIYQGFAGSEITGR
ncbi:MAG: hypothetical protein EOO77_24980 [Oxalobacteraceae bacterium]|nr:MAG: hypothetical protein EOO77_24980 [Oxalobacteraceae bacterium]